MRPGQLLAGLAGGPPGQRGGGPPVHEHPLLPLLAGDGQQAGGLAGRGLLAQAGRRPERRGRRPVQLGEVQRQLLPDRAGDGGQVEGLVHGDPGGGQDSGDLLGGGRPVRGVACGGVGLPGGEQDRVGVGWFPVHRDTQEQAGGAGDLGQPGEQVLEQDVVGGQRDGLGQGGVQAGAGGQPLAAGGAVQAAGDRVAEPSGDVGVAGGAAGQQRVEVFQGPGVPAGQPPHLLKLVFTQLIQGGQGPGQLHRLGLGQRPQLPERQRLLGPAGQGEPVPARHQQPAPPCCRSLKMRM